MTEQTFVPAPSPLKEPPKSFTTTLAPLDAKKRAYDFPRPPPAPVTTTVWLSKRSSCPIVPFVHTALMRFRRRISIVVKMVKGERRAGARVYTAVCEYGRNRRKGSSRRVMPAGLRLVDALGASDQRVGHAGPCGLGVVSHKNNRGISHVHCTSGKAHQPSGTVSETSSDQSPSFCRHVKSKPSDHVFSVWSTSHPTPVWLTTRSVNIDGGAVVAALPNWELETHINDWNIHHDENNTQRICISPRSRSRGRPSHLQPDRLLLRFLSG